MKNTNIEVDLTGDWREVIAAQEKLKAQGLSISYLPGKEATKKIIVGVTPGESVANNPLRKDDTKIDSHYQEFAKYFANITPQDIAIDCGANVGLITEILAARSKVVYAFEPNPFAYKVLSEKFVDVGNVFCFPFAVFDQNTTLNLYFHENSDEDEVMWSTGSSLLEYKSNVNKQKSTPVEAVDLAEFIQALKEPVKFLKIDVEGVEAKILNRLIDSGAIKQVDDTYVETHEKKIPETAADIEALRQKLDSLKISNVHLDWI